MANSKSNSKDSNSGMLGLSSRKSKCFRKPTMLRLNSVGEVVSPKTPNYQKNIESRNLKQQSSPAVHPSESCSYKNIIAGIKKYKTSVMDVLGIKSLDDFTSLTNLINSTPQKTDCGNLGMPSTDNVKSGISIPFCSVNNSCTNAVSGTRDVPSTNSVPKSMKYSPFFNIGQDFPDIGKITHCDLNKKFQTTFHKQDCFTACPTGYSMQNNRVDSGKSKLSSYREPIPTTVNRTVREKGDKMKEDPSERRPIQNCDIANTFQVTIRDSNSCQTDHIPMGKVSNAMHGDGDQSGSSNCDVLFDIDLQFADRSDSFTWDNIYDEDGDLNPDILKQDDTVKQDNNNCGSIKTRVRFSSFSCSSDSEMEKPDEISNKRDDLPEEKQCDRIKFLYIRSPKKIKRKRRKTKNVTKTEGAIPDKSAVSSSPESKSSSESKLKIHFFDTNHFVVTADDYGSDTNFDTDSDEEFLSSSDEEHDSNVENNCFNDMVFGGLCDIKQFGVQVSVSVLSSPPTDVQCSYKQSVIDANSRWSKNYADGSCGKAAGNDLTQSSKVKFNESNLAEVHPMVTWSFAYQAARKGHWEEFVRDRDRFKRRIEEAETVLTPILSMQHRSRIYEKLQSKAD